MMETPLGANTRVICVTGSIVPVRADVRVFSVSGLGPSHRLSQAAAQRYRHRRSWSRALARGQNLRPPVGQDLGIHVIATVHAPPQHLRGIDTVPFQG
ncbi:MAG: hypothetical protein Q8L74_04890 [Nitrospirota bacterium]|nr:hypothetical protein [Nitrospirota bacterium]